MYIVSACLAGVPCRYDGKANSHPYVQDLVREGKAIMVCPEQLGGLTTPRACAEIREGKVIDQTGKDVTEAFQLGAQYTLEIAQMYDCSKAILKAKSPSCGCGKIYNGKFEGQLIDGDGLTGALLKMHGISVCTEQEIEL